MRILITGGAGFIGSHLSERLLNDGHEVICIDNYFTGSRANITPFMANPNFEVIRHDITMPLYLEVDQIYNLACPASPVHYQENPVRTIKMGTVAMVNMLGLAKRCHARILQASTSEVYGDPEEHPQKETYWGHVNPIGPRSCYDEGKRVAESLMMAYHLQSKVDIRIARIFNTYGPRMALNDGRVLTNFVPKALAGTPLVLYGKGNQTRSFCYIDDMVEGLVRLMNTVGVSEPVNLGNPEEISILALARLVKKLTHSRSAIHFGPALVDDPHKRQPDITRARKLLKWKPTISLEKGLPKMIDFYLHSL